MVAAGPPPSATIANNFFPSNTRIGAEFVPTGPTQVAFHALATVFIKRPEAPEVEPKEDWHSGGPEASNF